MTSAEEVKKIDLLDHGFVTFVESWGSDESIIEAARMSTQKGFEGWGPKQIFTCSRCGIIQESEAYKGEDGGWGCYRKGSQFGSPDSRCWAKVEVTMGPGDEKLLRYLWENKHATPFEMAGAVFEVMAPISVFRQWHRHRTQSYNEMSSRYVPLPDIDYVPDIERLLQSSSTNKQAGTIKGAKVLDADSARLAQHKIKKAHEFVQGEYEDLLNLGVPKELARDVLPLGRYSCMRASANLRNWLGFLSLRMDPHAQWEIRQYANAVFMFLNSVFPRTSALFSETKTK